MNILLTGGAGFIGAYTARHLIDEGFNVRVFDNLSTGSKNNVPVKAEFVEADVIDREAVSKALADVDVVVHLAARVSVRTSVNAAFEDAKNNVLGTLSLLEESLRKGIKKFVFASSMAVYAEPLGNRRLAETDLTQPLSPYGVAKLAAENYVKVLCEQNGVEWVVLRLFNVYGAGQKYTNAVGIVRIVLEAIKRGANLTLFNYGKNVRDFIFVEDVAKAIVMAVKFDGSGVFNIGTGVGTSVRSLVELLFDITGKTVQVKLVSPRQEELKCAVADTNKAQRILGFKAQTPLKTGLLSTLKAEGFSVK